MRMRTQKEIEEKMDECAPFTSGEEESRRFGMSYEEGVEQALRWVLDAEDEEADPLAP